MDRKMLLTVVTEDALEKAVVDELLRCGADSYTSANVRGRGPRREDQWEPREYRAVRIEVVCNPDVAETITRSLADRYFRGYSMTITATEVSLIRSHTS